MPKTRPPRKTQPAPSPKRSSRGDTPDRLDHPETPDILDMTKAEAIPESPPPKRKRPNPAIPRKAKAIPIAEVSPEDKEALIDSVIENPTHLVALERHRKHPQGRQTLLDSLTETEYEEMINFVRLGTYHYIAAERLGIAAPTFFRWLKEGKRLYHEINDLELEGVDPNSIQIDPRDYKFLKLYIDITKATAHARGMAEVAVKKDQPSIWLRLGPGRTLQDRPGWTEEIAVNHQGEVDINQNVNETVTHLNLEGDSLAEVLNVFSDLGMLNMTESGKQTLLPKPKPPLPGKTAAGIANPHAVHDHLNPNSPLEESPYGSQSPPLPEAEEPDEEDD